MYARSQEIVLRNIQTREPAETHEIRVCFNRHCHEREVLRRNFQSAANSADYR